MQVREGYLAARRGAGRRVPKEGFQIRIQRFPIGVGQIDKAERLHPSLGRPHGKQHLRLFSNRRCSDVKNQLDFQLLVQRFLEVDDSAGGRKLMEMPLSRPGDSAGEPAPAPSRAASREKAG